ncbi:hypothetical protein [Streptomyces sp. NPDC051546]|uniref:hypothetical protein n=1 Tax=Streptomyces sp. NPDC051546 TaxID=3365655 RepID=UPI0037A47C51
MVAIHCAECNIPYRANSLGLFVCAGCGKLLDPADIDLDGQESWTVDKSGTLGYVVESSDSLAESHTGDQVSTAINKGADLVIEALGLGEGPEVDAINLVVNSAIRCLENPGIGFAEVVKTCYDESVEEILGWWGWGY